MKHVTLLFVLLATASIAGEYVVGYGDTLSDISVHFYGTWEKWEDILAANPDLRGAEYLAPGMVLQIPDIDTAAETSVSSSTRYVTEIPAGAVLIRSSEPVLSRIQRESAGFVSYSPINPEGYVLATNAEDEGVYRNLTALSGDLLELDFGAGQGVEVGRVYHVLRKCEEIEDPETGNTGHIIRVAGVCQVESTTPSTCIAKVQHCYLSIIEGDFVVPYRAAGDIRIQNEPGVDRGLLWVLGFRDPDRDCAYNYDVVYLSAGSSHGISPGDVFTAYTASEQVRDVNDQWVSTAEIPIADVVVLTTEARSCAAMIVSTRTANLIGLGDKLYLSRSQVD
ncbi:MAG: LysM peptidoglycan-binding domain-containing protein [Candidatus Sabulitectum sp.]|nr:LysM peptidoglycan-binding domain-containing protein [Candidatus Sabulitectum sp.]